MPLTLEQYATYLDTRRDLPWPAPPEIDPPRAIPHLTRQPGVRAVLWNVYGTLVHLAGGELYFEHPQQFVMEVALDKTIQEFKMWGSMPRKPGRPADYLRRVYTDILTEQRLVPGGTEKFPEAASERVWEAFIKKLFQKDYKFDATFYGSLNEYSRKVAYFFHASLQGTACYPGAAEALRHVADQGVAQGLLADGQCFTPVQLQRGLAKQDASLRLDEVFDPGLRFLSAEVRARKPSERLFRQAVGALAERGISPGEVLHVGSNLARDLAPARRLGMKTALFIADKAALQLSPEQLKQALKEPANRPDVLLTELAQIAEVVSG
jgi:FMN phosphatase YigB (HAD superfamily)